MKGRWAEQEEQVQYAEEGEPQLRGPWPDGESGRAANGSPVVSSQHYRFAGSLSRIPLLDLPKRGLLPEASTEPRPAGRGTLKAEDSWAPGCPPTLPEALSESAAVGGGKY